LSRQTPDRLRIAAQAMREGLSIDEVVAATGFDCWYLERISEILAFEAGLIAKGRPRTAAGLRRLKTMRFSDARVANLTGLSEAEVRAARWEAGVTAVYKRIDTCAAEFEAQTPYMYSTYEAAPDGHAECEARP